MIPGPRTTDAPCEAHRYHSPLARYREEHHVVPQAWSRFWRPEGVVVPRDGVWDRRITALCRTGHGNVHWLLVRIMRAGATEDPAEARRAFPGSGADYEIAYLALTRWREAGGSLVALREARLFGGI